MYYDKDGFYYQYGMLFSALYPNIDVEVLSANDIPYVDGEDRENIFMEFVDERKPDILMLNAKQYGQLSSQGKLVDLETLAKRDKFDLDGIVPGIIEYIRELSDGKLFGMAPSFYSRAVYYNKDLFEKYGVPYPKDKMDWEELLQLASRFPTTGKGAERIYGLKTDYYYDSYHLYNLGTAIGNSLELDYFNSAEIRMTLNSESWKNAFEMANQALRSGYLYSKEDPNGMTSDTYTYTDYLFQDPFIGGRVAMTMEGNGLIGEIKQSQVLNKIRAIRNWDVVTMPVNPHNPNVTSTTSVDQIFAINAGSANKEAAWKLLSYVNGVKFAKVKSKTIMGNFPVRMEYISDAEGHNLKAFYDLKPVEASVYKDYDKIPNKIFGQIVQLTQQEMLKVTKEHLSVTEALANIQDRGQSLLNGVGKKSDNATE